MLWLRRAQRVPDASSGMGFLIVKRFVSVFRAGGVAGVVSAVIRRIRRPQARCFPAIKEIVGGATGIEIGGPSPIFARGGMIPVYPLAKRIDNVNFSRSTIWQHATEKGESFTFHPGKTPGKQIIAEGADLREISSAKYDFVLSSHMLEHTANPLGALAEWRRLLRPGGALVLVVPHRDGTFDHLRPITTISHLVEDSESNMGEDDLTHLPEVLRLHDLSRDSEAGDVATFRKRAERNPQIRSMHHHVFDTSLAAAAVTTAAFDLVAVEPLQPYHIIIVARNPLEGAAARSFDEEKFRMTLRESPFRSDRQSS